jgi:hypothetical protein
MQRTRPLTPFTRWPRIALGVLLAALLWAQLLGQVHGVLHAGWAPNAALEQSTSVLPASVPSTDVFGHLFSPAHDESKCRLYDQLGQTAPTQHVLPLAALPLVWWPTWIAQTAQGSTFCAAFSARAPPAAL